MAVFVRIRAWRARRKERKAEELATLAASGPKDDAGTLRAAREKVDPRLGQPGWKHAGKEGERHY
jgi:hypothetical protein